MEGDDQRQEVVDRLLRAMRSADRKFADVGGTTRHFVVDYLLPELEKNGVVLSLTPPEKR